MAKRSVKKKKKGTAAISKKRLARLRGGYPLSTGRTPKKPPRTRRKKGDWELPGKGRYD